MTCRVLIVGVPMSADCAADRTWRAAATFIERRLVARFGAGVGVEYVELFSPEMTGYPDIEAQIAAGEAVPPIVTIDGARRFSGGKLNVSAIERAVAEVGGSGEPVLLGMEGPAS